MRLATIVAACSLALIVSGGLLRAQTRGGGSEWTTAYADAQRTSWIRNDAAISVESMAKPGFELQWTSKLAAQGQPSTALFQGVTINGVMLFHPLTIVTGASNRVSAIDMDTGFVLWDRQYDLPSSASSSVTCPGGITAAAARVTNLVPPAPAAPRGGGGGGGRGGYTSAVGEPGAGAPVPQRGGGGGGRAGDPVAGAGAAAAGRGGDPVAGAGAGAAGRGGDPVAGAGAAAAGRGADPAGGRGTAPAGRGADPAAAGGPGRTGGGGGGGGRGGTAIYAISGDGLLHTLGPSSGKDVLKPTPFLAANARFSDPIVVGNMMYVTTSGNCGGAADGVWGLDLAAESRPVASWRVNGGSPVGPLAFTTDGTIILAVGPGTTTMGGFANAIVALDPKTLQPKDWFTQPSAEFVTGPLVFVEGDKTVVAAATKDGRLWLLDAASLGGANHSTPMHVSRSFAASGMPLAPGALAMWQQVIPAPTPPPAAAPAPTTAAPTGPPAPPAPTVLPGTRWLLLPVSGGLPTDLGVPATGAITNGAILAIKVQNSNGRFSLEPGWVSGDLASPMTPLVVNGVVFGLSRGGRTLPAVLHAWDGMTGRELWNSGKAIISPATGPSFWSGTGQVYVGTSDGTVYAFGFAMERK